MLILPVGVLPGGLLLHLGGLSVLKPGAVLSAVCIRPAANVSSCGEVPASCSTGVTVPPLCQEALQV